MTPRPVKSIIATTILLLAACSRGPTPDELPTPTPAPQPEATATEPSLVGTWSIRRTPPIATPFLLDLEIDSVVGSTAFGRITRFFAGDVGADPADWKGFAAQLTDSTIAISVRHRGLGDTVFQLDGERAADSIELSEFRVSGANLIRESAQWHLVRADSR